MLIVQLVVLALVEPMWLMMNPQKVLLALLLSASITEMLKVVKLPQDMKSRRCTSRKAPSLLMAEKDSILMRIMDMDRSSMDMEIIEITPEVMK